MVHFRHPSWCVLYFLILLIILCPNPSKAAEQIFISITLNTEKKGDFLILRSADGDFFVRESDLNGFGITPPMEKEQIIDGEKYFSLKSLTGVTYSFDENKVALDVRADPELLPTKIIDLFPPRRTNIYYPHDYGAFLNYGVDYSRTSSGVDNITATQQLGVQGDNVLLLSDSVYTDNSSTKKVVRLMSSLTVDNRNDLTRFVGGDSFATSGDLGSTLNLGGVSFSKVYRMNPYLITYPTVNFAGAASLPSDAELYVNGMKMRTEKLPAGGFDFKNITSYIGAGSMEIVLRDPFGREQRISHPYYFTNQLLHKGLHEYSYNMGFERKNFGVEGNSYGGLAFSGFHRYGLTDAMTIGGSIEGASDVVAIGGQSSWIFPELGMVTTMAGASVGETGKNGVAGSAAYLYQSIEFNSRLAVRGFSPTYTIVAGNTGNDRIRYDTSATVGYGTRPFGSVSLSGTYTALENRVERIFTIAYARNLNKSMSLSATYSYGGKNSHESKYFTGISWNPAPNTIVSTRVENTQSSRNEVIEIQKNAPIGEGFGYHALASHSANGFDSYTLNSALQYNGRFGRYTGEYTGLDSGTGTQNNYHLNGAGSVLFVGNRVGFARPVGDSFALVKVGNLEGVKVFQYAQEMGSTNSRGELFIPEMASFNDNLVSIKAGNIPLNYALKNIDLTISPPYRSGSCVIFPVKKLQPVTGILKTINDGKVKPLEFAELTIDTDSGKVVIPSGLGGEFYWEEGAGTSSPQNVLNGCSAITESDASEIKPGRYHGEAVYENRTYRFEFSIPKSELMITDVGEIIAVAASEKGLEKPAEEKAVLERNGEKPLSGPELPVNSQVSLQLPVPETSGVTGMETVAASTSREKAAPSSEMSGEPLVIEVYFSFGTTDLASKADKATLITVARLLQTIPDSQVIIEGHTDQIGSHRYNMLLSKKRARKIADIFKEIGIPVEKNGGLDWFGKKLLRCFSYDESCRRLNRRVVVRFSTKPRHR